MTIILMKGFLVKNLLSTSHFLQFLVGEDDFFLVFVFNNDGFYQNLDRHLF